MTDVSRPRHAFTVDLEEWFHGIELPEHTWPMESRLHLGLDRLLSLLELHSVKATFFVLGVVAERFPEIVRELDLGGHEIACHGHSHQFVYHQSPGQFREDIRRSRGSIGMAVGSPPRGYRAPYFSIRRDSLWAIDILASEGFTYDSSIFPVHNYRYGIPDAPCAPHDLYTAEGPVRELPMTPAHLLGRQLPFSGGAYLRILPWWAQWLAWKAADRQGNIVITYIHPWELDPDHPVVALPRRVSLTHYARLPLTERRLDRLLSQFDFGRLDEVFSLS